MKVYIGPYKDKGQWFGLLDALGFPRSWNIFLKRFWDKMSGERRVIIKIDKYDNWSLDHTLALIILPALKDFRQHKQGVPGNFVKGESNEDFAKAEQAWKATVDLMIFAFQSIVDDDNDFNFDTEEGRTAYYEHQDKVRKGLALFGKHFQNLWT